MNGSTVGRSFRLSNLLANTIDDVANFVESNFEYYEARSCRKPLAPDTTSAQRRIEAIPPGERITALP